MTLSAPHSPYHWRPNSWGMPENCAAYSLIDTNAENNKFRSQSEPCPRLGIQEQPVIDQKRGSNKNEEENRLCDFLVKNGDQFAKSQANKYQETGNIKFLNKIFELNLTSKNLTSLPPEIKLLQSLKKLELVNNQLTDLPKEFSSLKNLRILKLAGNLMENVPTVLKEMTWLVELYLYNNPLKGLPVFLDSDIIKSCPPDINWID